MSRPLLILILVLVALVAATVWLASGTHEVPLQRIEAPVTNEAAGG